MIDNKIQYKQIIPLLSDIGVDISTDDEIAVYDKSAQTTKRLSLENLSSFIDPIAFDGATTGSVLFAGALGELSQDNDGFYYNSTTGALKLVDKNYVPFFGSLNADVLFAVGSNDNNQNNPGVVTTSNHFVGSATDLKITASGANKTYTGQLTQFRVGGGYTGSNTIYGHHIILNNRMSSSSTPNLYGLESSINIEGNFTEAVGISAIAYRGTTVTGDKIVGIRAQAANGYANANEVTGVEAVVRTVSLGATISDGTCILARQQITSGHTVSTAIGLKVGNWVNSGNISESYGIWIDNSIDVGIGGSFPIFSSSTGPSYLSGSLTAPSLFVDSEEYGGTWESNLGVPTKKDLYNKIEALIISGGGYTDEQAQDAIGAILSDGNTVSLQYNDFDDVITAEVIEESLTLNYLQHIDSNTILGNWGASEGPVQTIKLGPGFGFEDNVLVTVPAGSTTQIQYNNAGVIGASSNLTFDNTLNDLKVGNSINAGGSTPQANIYFNLDKTGTIVNGTTGCRMKLYKQDASGTITGIRTDVQANAAVSITTLNGIVSNYGTNVTGAGITNGIGLTSASSVLASSTLTTNTNVFADASITGTSTTQTNFRARAQVIGASGSVTSLYLARLQASLNQGTIGTRYGLSIDGWANTGTITTSYGIYIDTSIDSGTNKYCIYSLSTSPSIFSGDVSVPDEAYGAGWNGSLEVPTKNAIYDKIQTISSANDTKTLIVHSNEPGNIGTVATALYNDGIGGFLLADGDFLTGEYAFKIESNGSNNAQVKLFIEDTIPFVLFDTGSNLPTTDVKGIIKFTLIRTSAVTAKITAECIIDGTFSLTSGEINIDNGLVDWESFTPVIKLEGTALSGITNDVQAHSCWVKWNAAP